MSLLTMKWKVVQPKLKYVKHVIVSDNWECSCDKEDDSYAEIGCICHVGSMTGLSFGWEKKDVAEHIVQRHNEWLFYELNDNNDNS